MLIELILRELEQLRAELEPPPDTAQDELGAWRRRIDTIDRILLMLLNERSRSANEIGRIKKDLQLPVYVPKREEDVLRQVLQANEGPLPDTAVRRLFERVIDETRSLERQKYQDE